jgi:hypothetical protein
MVFGLRSVIISYIELQTDPGFSFLKLSRKNSHLPPVHSFSAKCFSESATRTAKSRAAAIAALLSQSDVL